MLQALKALFALLTVTILYSTVQAETVKSYEVSPFDLTYTNGTECDIVSGSVTIVSCPKENKFTVYLSEMLVNTTITEIENEIKGVDDSQNVRYDPVDEVRTLNVTGVNITSVRLSKEKLYDKYVDSVIVIFVNETQTNVTDKDNDDWEWQHSVWRYWQNPDSFWIESEYLFDTKMKSRMFYTEVEVFDDYAIAYEAGDPEDDDKQDIWTVIFFKNYMADLVPNNFHVQAYKQENADVAGFCYWDRTGSGSWAMIVLVKYSGSIVVTQIQMIIQPTSAQARFSPNPSQTYLKVKTKVSYMNTFSQLLVIGCKNCNNGYGEVYFYDANSLALIYTLEGDKDAQQVGRQLEYRPNSGYSEQYWYTSYKNDVITLNSIVFFKKSGEETWQQKKDKNLFEITATTGVAEDELLYQPIGDSFIYKLNHNETLWTFLSCEYNDFYFTEDIENDDGSEDSPQLDNRNCTKCERRTPFSYGFNKDECKTCDSLVQFVERADEYIQYFYKQACGDYQPCDVTNTCNQEVEETGQTTIIDDFTGEEYIYVANVVQEEEQESSSGSIIFYLLLILVVLILIIVCYVFYKRHEKQTLNSKVHDMTGKRKKKKPKVDRPESLDGPQEGLPVAKPRLDHDHDARYDTNQSMEVIGNKPTNFYSQSKNSSHRAMVKGDSSIEETGDKNTNVTAPSNVPSKLENKMSADTMSSKQSKDIGISYVDQPASTLTYQGVGPTRGSVHNKKEMSRQKGSESMLPGIGGGNRGTFITPGTNGEDATAQDQDIL